MENRAMKSGTLVLTDHVFAPVRGILDSIRDAGIGTSGDDALVITQAASLGGELPLESSSVDSVVCVSKTAELVGSKWLGEISRVLKPGGKFLIQAFFKDIENMNKSTLERALLMAGFLDLQTLEMKPSLEIEGAKAVTVKANKASWKVGSSFTIKKATKIMPMPKIQIDDESDLIDEDSLLTEEDLKKPQLPTLGDCEVGSTRKACKNCTCGRAEAEQKVQLGLTAEQITNPQSACGSCGLGDAFRCSACPYKGLPPFKLGEKVSLSSNFLVADI